MAYTGQTSRSGQQFEIKLVSFLPCTVSRAGGLSSSQFARVWGLARVWGFLHGSGVSALPCAGFRLDVEEL